MLPACLVDRGQANKSLQAELASLVFYQPYQASKGAFKRRNIATLANRLNSSVLSQMF